MTKMGSNQLLAVLKQYQLLIPENIRDFN